MNRLNCTLTRLLVRIFRRATLTAVLSGGLLCSGQAKPAAPSKAAPNSAPDVLVLSDGDTLHGKFVSEVAGKVTFHTESLGDVSLTWDKIKELHTAEPFAVLDKNVKLRGKKAVAHIPTGTLEVTDQAVAVHPENGPEVTPIPVKNAEYVVDQPTLDKEVFHQPGFFSGWNGAGTAGATLVTATQNQYTFSGAISLVRAVPSVSWLDTRNRTSADFSGSYGKITQPAYTVPGTPPTTVAAVTTKTAISHIDAERDQYFAPRFFALAQTAFDHNFGQNLALQQIYGGGIGWTAVKSALQELDLKGTIQYEKQQFIGGTSATNPNLIGSTIAATYALHLKRVAYTQGLAFIPAFNDPHAYSANETNTFAFPAYKSLSFSVGTLDSYLNDPPFTVSPTSPPTKANSFQFTMGITYAIKSKY
jgi:Protein of unknown function, DUF481